MRFKYCIGITVINYKVQVNNNKRFDIELVIS